MEEGSSKPEETREESGSQSDKGASSCCPAKDTRRSLARLQDRKARKDLLTHGRKSVSTLVVIYFCENHVGKPRYAVYAGKRLGGAVQRNKIKRLFREALFLKKKMLSPYDFILIPREAAKAASFHEIAENLHRILLDHEILVPEKAKIS
ncbi:MAG: ribonuclease P protein component [Nitrospirota bacterium]